MLFEEQRLQESNIIVEPVVVLFQEEKVHRKQYG